MYTQESVSCQQLIIHAFNVFDGMNGAIIPVVRMCVAIPFIETDIVQDLVEIFFGVVDIP